jgi:hypothetical protein
MLDAKKTFFKTKHKHKHKHDERGVKTNSKRNFTFHKTKREQDQRGEVRVACQLKRTKIACCHVAIG